MTAQQIPDGSWMYILRTKKWYNKRRHGKRYTEGFQIGDKKMHLIPNDEPVELKKK